VPELPEVETVRAGLQQWVAGRTIATVEVRHPRAVRRHAGGGADLSGRLAGLRIEAASRRGKYLWLQLADAEGSTGDALVAHLGMSGQFLVRPAGTEDEKHLHIRFDFADGGPELRFVDQRTFGGVLLDRLVPAADRPEENVPQQIAHIARDPMDPHFDDALFTARLRRRDTEVKRALLDQSLISGVGNIYADEALWRAKLHGAPRPWTPAAPLSMRST
jgi:formamidopyrimidine-DNA glycosylase